MHQSEKAEIKKMRSIKTKAFAVVLVILTLLSLPFTVSGEEETKMLIPSGAVFGVKFFTKGALVLGTTGVKTEKGVVSPAKDCGIKKGDVIIRACGKEFESASELITLIESSGGKSVSLAVNRGGEEISLKATPVYDRESGKYRIGIFVRDSAAGIGTVTYIVPDTGEFGGLGHGIYDSETSSLLPLGSAPTVDVTVTGIIKSLRDDPGEINGNFGIKKTGELFLNTDQGVFGKFSVLPKNLRSPLPVANKSEIRAGKAYILSTLDGGGAKEYEIEIEKIYPSSESVKNFLIRVTDKALLEKTGGIVRGMSGSPIIQSGKLVGAVTHVLVGDPTHGYGIFIENMLAEQKKAGNKSTRPSSLAA